MSVDYAALAERLRAVIEREIAVQEKLLAQTSVLEPGTPERERNARSLAALAKLLHGLALVDGVAGEQAEEKEGQIRDLDEFQRELSRQLAAVRGTRAPA
jgi:hypothetical protein